MIRRHEALSKQAEALTEKLPEYYNLMDGLEKVDPSSSEVGIHVHTFRS
jgi:hypothetical protein